MKIRFKDKWWKVTLLIMSGFAVLFLFRLVYGYTSKMSFKENDYIGDFFEDVEQTKRNYASDSYKFRKVEATVQQNVAPATAEYDVNQKYEKTSSVKSKTENFDTDKKKLFGAIERYNSIIQFEHTEGNRGSRELYLTVGVQPDKFDVFNDDVKKIGNIRSFEITKTDKTNEYKNLNAKKISLEKIRESLIALKSQSGRIEEFINLQNRILEIESQLQELGVLLGDFDEENEFCTVKYSLVEGKTIPVGFLHRLKVAFEWAISFYLQFLIIIALATFSAFIILLIIDRLKILSNTLKKINE